jgi:hypothetical protein
MSFERFRRIAEGEDDIHLKPETTYPTIREMAKDSKTSRLFGEHLKAGGNDELVQHWLEGTLDEDDRDALDREREVFWGRKKSFEEISKTITPDFIKSISKFNPGLKTLVERLADSKSIHGAFISALEEMAAKSPDEFDTIKDMVEDHTRQKQETRELFTYITDAASRYNIKGEEYERVLAIEDPDERREQLETLVKKNIGFLERLFTPKEILRTRAKEIDNADEMYSSLQNLRGEEEQIADTLMVLVNENEDVQGMVNNILAGGELEKTKKSPELSSGFKEARGSLPQREQLEKDTAGWKMLPIAEQDKRMNAYIANRFTGKRGFLIEMGIQLMRAQIRALLS